jgi:hypothetical protein
MLWDVLIALGLTALFLSATTQILRATMRIPYRANAAEARATRFDGLVDQLRRDVWNATSLAAAGGGREGRSVRIDHGAGEPPVTWTIDDAGSISRTDAGKQTWADVAKGMTFQIDGPLLVLIEPPDARGEGRRIPLVSAVSLSHAGRSS